MNSDSIKNRFYGLVDVRGEDECWNWTGAVDRKGYGQLGYVGGKKGKQWRAHRFSYFLHYDVDPGQYWVLHSCDNPSCVNPKHLRLGTSLENNRETSAKGRYQNPIQKSPVVDRSVKKKSGPRPRSIEDRFWEKVDKRGPDECWNWKGYLDRNGYGHIGTGSRTDKSTTMIRAPRFSYLLHYGVDPSELSVLHSCDNPACVNPAHLRLGTQAENNRDTVDHNRHHSQKTK